jgi:hypothetical protein
MLLTRKHKCVDVTAYGWSRLRQEVKNLCTSTDIKGYWQDFVNTSIISIQYTNIRISEDYMSESKEHYYRNYYWTLLQKIIAEHYYWYYYRILLLNIIAEHYYRTLLQNIITDIITKHYYWTLLQKIIAEHYYWYYYRILLLNIIAEHYYRNY